MVGDTPLIESIRTGRVEQVFVLLHHPSIDVEQTTMVMKTNTKTTTTAIAASAFHSTTNTTAASANATALNVAMPFGGPTRRSFLSLWSSAQRHQPLTPLFLAIYRWYGRGHGPGGRGDGGAGHGGDGLEILELLLKDGNADLEKTDHQGDTALMCVLRRLSSRIPSAATGGGVWTPTEVAAGLFDDPLSVAAKSCPTVQLLLRYGANVYAPNTIERPTPPWMFAT